MKKNKETNESTKKVEPQNETFIKEQKIKHMNLEKIISITTIIITIFLLIITIFKKELLNSGLYIYVAIPGAIFVIFGFIAIIIKAVRKRKK